MQSESVRLPFSLCPSLYSALPEKTELQIILKHSLHRLPQVVFGAHKYSKMALGSLARLRERSQLRCSDRVLGVTRLHLNRQSLLGTLMLKIQPERDVAQTISLTG
jgi:hypothetical protein